VVNPEPLLLLFQLELFYSTSLVRCSQLEMVAEAAGLCYKEVLFGESSGVFFQVA
jgi:hypothetical protein